MFVLWKAQLVSSVRYDK